jgi:hypothetical protein
MGLRIWNQLSDLYNHDQLADNWSKLDLHDHTPGRGIRIPAEGINNEAIIGSKISPAFMQTVEGTFGSIAPGDVVVITLNWPVAFADALYRTFATTRNSLIFASVTGRTTTNVTVAIRNPTDATSPSGVSSVASAVQVLGIRL